jgi:uncharacterized LabA/DUF88 family protein
VKIFIDAQNCYRDARRTFFTPADPSVRGQISPRRFGEALVALRNVPADRQLLQVRVYSGRPNSTKEPKTYAAHMRQCAAWGRQAEVVVIARSLRYPRNWPNERPQEKGIDVQLAVDLVRGYVAQEFDIGIVASTDTDLLPAIEAVLELDRKLGYDPVEVCAWHAQKYSQALRIAGRNLYAHDLPVDIYNRVADPTDYNVK